MPVFETRTSKMKMFWAVLGSIVFVALGLWMIMYPDVFSDSRHAALVPYIAWMCVIFFGLLGLIALLQIFSSKTQIRADENGVFARRLSNDLIPWSIIDSVDVKEIRMGASRQVYFILHMSKEVESQIRFNRIYSMSTGANKAFGIHGPHFVLNGLIDDPDYIANELATRFQFYRR